MRSVFVLSLLVFCFSGFGQIINFPDPNFKDALVNSKCVDTDGDGFGDVDADVNNDGEIDVNEALQIERFLFSENGIISLEGIQEFSNLKKLRLHNLQFLEELQLSRLPLLEDVTCNFTPSINKIALDSLPALLHLTVYSSGSDSFELGNLPSLDSLHIHETSIQNIYLNELPSLQKLLISNNILLKSIFLNNLYHLDSFVINQNRVLAFVYYTGDENLKKLICNDNEEIVDLSLTSFRNLTEVYIQNANRIKTLDFNHLSDLEIVTVTLCDSLTSFEVSDLNQLQEIKCNGNQQLEALSFRNLPLLTTLIIEENKLKSLNLENLPVLSYLDCRMNELSNLDVSVLPEVTELLCSFNMLTNLDVTNLNNLSTLACNNNLLSTLNVSGLENLLELDCSGNQLENLNLFGLNNLLNLNCGLNLLSTLDVSDVINLTVLEFGANRLTSLDVTALANLSSLFCNGNLLTNLFINGLDNLKVLSCEGNLLTSQEFIGCNNIEILDISSNMLETVDISNLKNVRVIDFSFNQLSSLNVNGLTNLNNLDCNNNLLNFLLIKTGNILSYIYFENNPDLTYICCNENDISEVQNNALVYGLINCVVNSYCSFTPGGKFYTLKGEITYDKENNGCDNSDQKIPGFKFNISNGIADGTIISNTTGKYSIPVQEGTHIITPVLENSDFFEVSPPSLTLTFPANADTITQNFCITPKEPFRQIDITIIPLTPPARPGFDVSYKIIWENKGNLLENGTIHFWYDEAIFDYISTTINPDMISSGNLQWNYTNLLPFEKREIIVTLNLNSPMENPPVNAGDITYLYANILDNVFRLENVIVGSYDPNDKTCLQGQYFHPDSVGKYVDFLIRFENTGNFAAENVVIKDIIDDKTFDVSSLLITDASHEVYTRIAANKVEFIFENIQLPFEDETNDGYVAFKIKTNSTLRLGDEMKNLADIYFDYNFPIRTNETQTTIAIPSGTKDIQTEVTIHPNPVRDVLTLDSSNRWTKAEIFDISGRLIKVTGVEDFSVDVIGLDSGTYILHLSDKDKRGRVKFVKM
jgi:uncharacterized repeat protein (TIGR01451 family)